MGPSNRGTASHRFFFPSSGSSSQTITKPIRVSPQRLCDAANVGGDHEETIFSMSTARATKTVQEQPAACPLERSQTDKTDTEDRQSSLPVNQVTRRRFMQGAAATTMAAPWIIPGTALGANGRTSANERIVMGVIGCGEQGMSDMDRFSRFYQVQIAAVCDPVPSYRNRAKAAIDRLYRNRDCQAHNDFREVLDNKNIDAVLCATPDHWHAIVTIEACKHGKDVYCEKPESLTIHEGRAMVEAARRYGRVVSGGAQRVPDDYGDLPRQVRGGAIGKVTEIFVNCGGPSDDCYLPEEALPEGVDWEMWLGPAPWRPYHHNLIQGGFRPYRDYSGGNMTDWGTQRFGAATFAAGVHETGPVEVIPPHQKGENLLTFVYANGLKIHHGGSRNITYQGEKGTLPGKSASVPKDFEIEGYAGKEGGIFGDFLDCVVTRERPFRDIEIAHRTCTVCHSGNLAYWLNRPLKWDPVKEEIIGDPEASRWLDRPKRAPWVL